MANGDISPIGTSGRSKLVRRRVSQVTAGIALQVQWKSIEEHGRTRRSPMAGGFLSDPIQAVVLKAFPPEEKVGLSQSVCGGYIILSPVARTAACKR